MAKKRHHASKKQNFRDRMHEHEGMEHSYDRGERQMAKHGERYPANIGARPMMERHRSMISDDRSAPCNLPQMVMEKYWPVSHNNNMGYVDDLFEGVNKQMHEDYSELGRIEGPKKY